MRDVRIKTKSGGYPVVIGESLDKRLRALLKSIAANNRLFVLVDANVYALFGKSIESTIKSAKVNYSLLSIPVNESAKSQKTLIQLYDYLINAKISRTDVILAVGGGVLTDLAGYAAATTMRGIRWAAIPTTLMGMLDAAIGGKTGINHKLGKNLIGAFWQPSFVLCDLRYLNTLPSRELVAGFGELLKYAGLIGPKMVSQLKRYLNSGDLPNLKLLKPLIHAGAGYKAKIVSKDERESNLRMFLNFGHTFAHAIEKSLGYGKLLHGEAVIIGVLAAVNLSKKANPKTAVSLANYEKLVHNFVKFVRYYPVKTVDILENMKVDKKRSGAVQKFVLLRRPGQPFIASDPKIGLVKEALEEALKLYRTTGK